MPSTVLIRHRFDDFDAWLERFVADTRDRSPVYATRSEADPDEFVVTMHFDSRAAAEEFLSEDQFRAALESAGVDEGSVRVEVTDDHEGPSAGPSR